MNNNTYVILNTSEITDENSTIDFSKLLNTNANYLRKSNDGTKAVVKYSGTQPSFLNGKTTYTHAEILVEMSTEDWLKEV
jgi:hypothetical protein|tara:strand:- start:310 stop:549 length:240 start_codon:yes stop_codon:yes gene_type:complete